MSKEFNSLILFCIGRTVVTVLESPTCRQAGRHIYTEAVET